MSPTQVTVLLLISLYGVTAVGSAFFPWLRALSLRSMFTAATVVALVAGVAGGWNLLDWYHSQHPLSVTAAQLETMHPEGGWFRVSGCRISWVDALSDPSPNAGAHAPAYVMVRAAGESSATSPRLYLITRNPQAVAVEALLTSFNWNNWSAARVRAWRASHRAMYPGPSTFVARFAYWYPPHLVSTGPFSPSRQRTATVYVSDANPPNLEFGIVEMILFPLFVWRRFQLVRARRALRKSRPPAPKPPRNPRRPPGSGTGSGSGSQSLGRAPLPSPSGSANDPSPWGTLALAARTARRNGVRQQRKATALA